EHGDSRRYKVRSDGQYTPGVDFWEMGELDMGDPQTLVDLVNWARDNYPSDFYYLAVSNHGGGTRGIAWETYRTPGNITVPELETALDAIATHNPDPVDVLHYDACLMSMIELAYQLQDHADHLIASENLGWSIFAYDRYILQAADGPTPRVLAGRIASEYFAALPGYPRTIAAIDLALVGDVVNATSALASSLTAALPAYASEIAQARAAAQKLDSRDYLVIDDYDEYVDLYHLAQVIAQHVPDPGIQAAAQNLIDTIGAVGGPFLVEELHESGTYGPTYWDLDNAHGLSIYYPPNPDGWGYNEYLAGDLPFVGDTAWDEFLVAYYGELALPPEVPVEPDLPPLLAPRFTVYLPFVTRGD
ncbi:MAG TPA: clostripain-related cysteine peptidase, partial [Anaerolineae bacterium]|nr:clostripain-related cysteine peptidase [Anaerolineae bacterium]